MNWPGIVQWYSERTEEFAAEPVGTPKLVVYLLPDAPHYFYLNDQAMVVLAMREFLLGKYEIRAACVAVFGADDQTLRVRVHPG